MGHIEKEFSTSWEIKATPTFFFLKDGQQVDRLVGANEEELIKKTEAAALMLTLVSQIRGHGSVPTFVMKKNLKISSEGSQSRGQVFQDVSSGFKLMKFMEVNKTNRLAASELKQHEKDIHVITGFYMDYGRLP
ncbi:thioredoxin H-type [Tanacetum coccineum]